MYVAAKEPHQNPGRRGVLALCAPRRECGLHAREPARDGVFGHWMTVVVAALISVAALIINNGPRTAGPRPGAMASTDPELTHDEIRRYSRHLILDDFGVAGQRKLKGTSMLCIGSGGLGSPALMYLAAAGVGTIGCVDDDVVDESNLQRQVVHSTQAVGTPKVDSAAMRVEGINPNVEFRKHTMRLTAANALELIAQYDIVVDGSDNFPTRYLVRAMRRALFLRCESCAARALRLRSVCAACALRVRCV